MAIEVRLTAQAMTDLEEIHGYIRAHDGVARADRTLQAIQDRIAGLASLPERGNVTRELADLGVTAFREIHYKPYRVIYRTVGATVFIDAVLDGRRDMRSLLQHRLLR